MYSFIFCLDKIASENPFSNSSFFNLSKEVEFIAFSSFFLSTFISFFKILFANSIISKEVE